MAFKHSSRTRNRKHRTRRDKSRPRAGLPVLITADLAGAALTTKVIDPACYEATVGYIQAHALLPDGFDANRSACRGTVAGALATLDDPNATSDARLRAIVILGHTPSEAALAALQRHAESGGELAAVAMIAADECTMWIGQEPARLGAAN